MNQPLNTPTLFEDERLDEVNEHIRLIQKKQGLTFGTDAYLLSAFVRPQPHCRAVDLGSGTGIIPLLLCTKNKIGKIAAVEIQPAFADLIERNAALNGLSDRIRPICADLRTLRPDTVGGEVELVCANPPYMKLAGGRTNRAPEKEQARHEIHGGIEDFCAAAGRLLKSRGRFVSVFRAERLSDLLAALRANRMEPKRMVMVHSDLASSPCMVLTEAVKDASPSLKLLPPLILYREMQPGSRARELTPQAAAVYEHCAFPDSLPLSPENKKLT